MKKTHIYLLILVLVLPFGLSELILNLQLISVKKEVKEMLIHSLDESELVQFHFSQEEYAQLNWVHEHEFILDGLYFDVTQRSEDESGIYLTCFPDKQETALNHRLDDLRKLAWGQHLPSKKNQSFYLCFLKNLFFASNYSLSQEMGSSEIHKFNFIEHVSPGNSTVTPPPPEQVS